MYTSAIARIIGTCFPHEVLLYRDLLTADMSLFSNMLTKFCVDVTVVQRTIHCKLREILCKPAGHKLFLIK